MCFAGMEKEITDGAVNGKDSIDTDSFDNSTAAAADLDRFLEGLMKASKMVAENATAYRYGESSEKCPFLYDVMQMPSH